MRFVIIDHAGNAGDLAKAAAALNIFANRDVGTHWKGDHSVRVASSVTDIADGEIAVAIVQSLPDAPDAVAYHSISGAAVPFVMVALEQCPTFDELTIAMSHEIGEAIGDAGCNSYYDDGQGLEHAGELCDATQGDSYDIDGVKVSNFVLPSYFEPGAQGPYTYLGTLDPANDPIKAPFATAKNGYQIVRTSGSGEHQTFGRHVLARGDVIGGLLDGGKLTAFLKRKSHPLSRTWKRGVRVERDGILPAEWHPGDCPHECEDPPVAKYNEECDSCAARAEDDRVTRSVLGSAIGAAVGALAGRYIAERSKDLLGGLSSQPEVLSSLKEMLEAMSKATCNPVGVPVGPAEPPKAA